MSFGINGFLELSAEHFTKALNDANLTLCKLKLVLGAKRACAPRNTKLEYLAAHHKKARVRKKNQTRLNKWLEVNNGDV